MPDTLAIVVQPQVTVGVVVTPPTPKALTLGLQGPVGPKGDSGSIGAISINEPAIGLLDGINKTFTLLHPAAQLTLTLNGITQMAGLANDFTYAGNTITFTSAPRPGDVILATYTY